MTGKAMDSSCKAKARLLWQSKVALHKDSRPGTHFLLARTPAVKVDPLLPPHPTSITLQDTVPQFAC